MTSLFVLVPIAFGLALLAAAAFAWAVRHDQFDDLGRPGTSILFDDDLGQRREDERSDRSRTNP